MIATGVTVRETGKTVNVGDEITSFRGETWIFEGVTRAPHENDYRDAKVQVRQKGIPSDFAHEMYASVFGLSVEPVL